MYSCNLVSVKNFIIKSVTVHVLAIYNIYSSFGYDTQHAKDHK